MDKRGLGKEQGGERQQNHTPGRDFTRRDLAPQPVEGSEHCRGDKVIARRVVTGE